MKESCYRCSDTHIAVTELLTGFDVVIKTTQQNPDTGEKRMVSIPASWKLLEDTSEVITSGIEVQKKISKDEANNITFLDLQEFQSFTVSLLVQLSLFGSEAVQKQAYSCNEYEDLAMLADFLSVPQLLQFAELPHDVPLPQAVNILYFVGQLHSRHAEAPNLQHVADAHLHFCKEVMKKEANKLFNHPNLSLLTLQQMDELMQTGKRVWGDYNYKHWEVSPSRLRQNKVVGKSLERCKKASDHPTFLVTLGAEWTVKLQDQPTFANIPSSQKGYTIRVYLATDGQEEKSSGGGGGINSSSSNGDGGVKQEILISEKKCMLSAKHHTKVTSLKNPELAKRVKSASKIAKAGGKEIPLKVRINFTTCDVLQELICIWAMQQEPKLTSPCSVLEVFNHREGFKESPFIQKLFLDLFAGAFETHVLGATGLSELESDYLGKILAPPEVKLHVSKEIYVLQALLQWATVDFSAGSQSFISKVMTDPEQKLVAAPQGTGALTFKSVKRRTSNSSGNIWHLHLEQEARTEGRQPAAAMGPPLPAEACMVFRDVSGLLPLVRFSFIKPADLTAGLSTSACALLEQLPAMQALYSVVVASGAKDRKQTRAALEEEMRQLRCQVKGYDVQTAFQPRSSYTRSLTLRESPPKSHKTLAMAGRTDAGGADPDAASFTSPSAATRGKRAPSTPPTSVDMELCSPLSPSPVQKTSNSPRDRHGAPKVQATTTHYELRGRSKRLRLIPLPPHQLFGQEKDSTVVGKVETASSESAPSQPKELPEPKDPASEPMSLSALAQDVAIAINSPPAGTTAHHCPAPPPVASGQPRPIPTAAWSTRRLLFHPPPQPAVLPAPSLQRQTDHQLPGIPKPSLPLAAPTATVPRAHLPPPPPGHLAAAQGLPVLPPPPGGLSTAMLERVQEIMRTQPPALQQRVQELVAHMQLSVQAAPHFTWTSFVPPQKIQPPVAPAPQLSVSVTHESAANSCRAASSIPVPPLQHQPQNIFTVPFAQRVQPPIEGPALVVGSAGTSKADHTTTNNAAF